MKETKVKVSIFGEEFTVKGDVSPDRIQRLAEFVDRQMKRISEKHPALGMSKVAILTALNLANELFRKREEEQKEGDREFEQGY